jgi:hypothetical protein
MEPPLDDKPVKVSRTLTPLSQPAISMKPLAPIADTFMLIPQAWPMTESA